MSFLKNIKGTLLEVQHDISASLKTITSREKKASDRSGQQQKHSSIDTAAGADLLNRFQEFWIEIHDDADEAAKRARVVDDHIMNIYQQCETCQNNMTQLNTEIRCMPQLVEDIHGIMEKIGNLEAMFSEIEESLMQLEDVIEENDLQYNMKKHKLQLAKYKERRDTELKDTKERLAAEHQTNLEDTEAKIRATIQQRQQAMQDMAVEDMVNYRIHGKKPEMVKRGSEEKVDLADINIEEDQAALDEFLNSWDHGLDETGDSGYAPLPEDEEDSDSDKQYPKIMEKMKDAEQSIPDIKGSETPSEGAAGELAMKEDQSERSDDTKAGPEHSGDANVEDQSKDASSMENSSSTDSGLHSEKSLQQQPSVDSNENIAKTPTADGNTADSQTDSQTADVRVKDDS